MGYLTYDGDLYDYDYSNTKLVENVKEICENNEYCINTSNELINISNNQKIASNVKNAYSINIAAHKNGYNYKDCYLTNNNEFYLLDGTLIANNVSGIFGDGSYLTLNNSLYDYTGTEIDNNVKKSLLQDGYGHYLKNDGQLFGYNGNKVKIADGVKDCFRAYRGSFEGFYYITNDNKTYGSDGNEVNPDELTEEDDWGNSYYELEDGRIMYQYYVDEGRRSS